jgi:LacI family transcriptional regulator
VRLDVEAGGAAIAEHLLGLGHRRLGRVVSAVYTSTFAVARPPGRRCSRRPVWIRGRSPDQLRHDRRAAVAAAGELLDGTPLPTAVFCDDDVLAAGLY